MRKIMSDKLSDAQRVAFEAWWADKYAHILTPDSEDDDANSACRIARIASSDAWKAALAHKSEGAFSAAPSSEEITAACTAYASGEGTLREVMRSVLIAARKAVPAAPVAVPVDASNIEQYVLSVLPSIYYMDPPDGGDVSILEQLRRMADDAAKYRTLTAAPAPHSGEAATDAAADVQGEAIYQIAFSDDEGGWSDTHKKCFNEHPAHMRRIVYNAPTQADLDARAALEVKANLWDEVRSICVPCGAGIDKPITEWLADRLAASFPRAGDAAICEAGEVVAEPIYQVCRWGEDSWRDCSKENFDAVSEKYRRIVHPAAQPQAAPSVDSRHVGDSNFERWHENYCHHGAGDKQRARDAYAAGMADMAQPLTSDPAIKGSATNDSLAAPVAWEVSSCGGRVDRIVVREDVANDIAGKCIADGAEDVRIRPLYAAAPQGKGLTEAGPKFAKDQTVFCRAVGEGLTPLTVTRIDEIPRSYVYWVQGSDGWYSFEESTLSAGIPIAVQRAKDGA
jgi:hypothetical protein